MMDENNPCTKDCRERCIGCKKGCYKYLEYSMFHKKSNKKIASSGVAISTNNKTFIPISIYDCNGSYIKSFDCIADCTRYMLNKYITGKNMDSLYAGIKKAIATNSTYMGFRFKEIRTL